MLDYYMCVTIQTDVEYDWIFLYFSNAWSKMYVLIDRIPQIKNPFFTLQKIPSPVSYYYKKYPTVCKIKLIINYAVN